MSSTKGSNIGLNELRKFGVVMAAAFSALGGLALWRHKAWGLYALALSAAFFIVGLVYPRLLGPIEKGWMAFARVMSIVMTYVILTFCYYLMFMPIGLLLRILGKDLLEMKRNPARSSFWVLVDPNGPCSRPNKPF